MNTTLENICDNLGLNRSNGLFFTNEDGWKTATRFPNRVQRLLQRKLIPDAFFYFDNKPLLLFFVDPSNKEELFKSIWNFNESPIAIIIEKGIVEIFNGFHFIKENRTLKKIGGNEKLNDFTYFELVTGHTWERYEEQLNYRNRVDYKLLENLKVTRNLLVHTHKLDAKVANSLIGKAIFIRYLIDRKVKMKFDEKLRTWSSSEFCELLNYPKKIQSFFDYLEDNDRGFNGDLFPLTSTEYRQISRLHYEVVRKLLQGEDLSNGQLSLFELFDFSIIPIEFISNVYELFIGRENQEVEGAYYTPLFLVDYILKETVERKISATDHEYRCKVLDPACGSGVFLVETLRKIIEKYIAVSGVEIKSEKFKTAIKNLAQENIFGIDKDISAVQVAIFSIYLTLLDYLEPPGIETFKFPTLLNSNFFEGDFFNEQSPFNERLKSINFDFIIGNPPWRRGKGESEKPLYVRYIEKRSEQEAIRQSGPTIAIGNKEIAQAFLLRVSDFSSVDTNCALIVTSKVLYNLQSRSFRKYLLHSYFVNQIFDLSPVRKEVFDKSNDKAVAPACVIFYRYSSHSDTSKNTIQHISLKPSHFFSLFKIFTLNRTDFKKITQGKLIEHDWMWKILVYGSYLDFSFIKRLKENYASIKERLRTDGSFAEGTGIQFSSNPTYDSKHLKGRPFIDARAITSFHIDLGKTTVFNENRVHRLRDEKLFKAPMLLIRKGLDMSSLTPYCAISNKDVVFKDSVTSIAVTNKSKRSQLKNIAALLNSRLFSYYAINTFSSVGIEREQTQNENKYSLPYVELDAESNFDAIETAYTKLHSEQKKDLVDDFKIQALKNVIATELESINMKVTRKLEFTDVELSLIDYSQNVSRILIVGDDKERKKLIGKLQLKDRHLTEYANLFYDRFRQKLETSDERFLIEVHYSDSIVGMIFKLVPVQEFNEPINWIVDDESNFLSLMSQLSIHRITEKLFVQKDIRGFEQNSFYIFKPNEKRLWHKAVAYLDAQEFADAILRTGREAVLQ